MDIKCESEEEIEVVNSDFGETESQTMSENSEGCFDYLHQTSSQISIDDYPGQFKFDFFFDLTEITKRQWMHSELLNKVYIDMDRLLPIHFQWDFDAVELKGIKSLKIRALPIFANTEFQHLSIKRCPLHIMQGTSRDQNKISHIVWCEQNDAIYEENLESRRHSVVLPVHKSALCSNIKTVNVMYTVLYKFMCKSSCSMSLNRRPIYVIFTLETSQGQVLGRKKLGVKVCSCPKRDMFKEEEVEKNRLSGIKMFRKRTTQDNDSNFPKKISKFSDYDIDENKHFELPLMHIPGKRLYLRTLELLHGHFLGSAVRNDCLIDCHSLISTLTDTISQVKSEINNHDNNVDSNSLLVQTNGKRLL